MTRLKLYLHACLHTRANKTHTQAHNYILLRNKHTFLYRPREWYTRFVPSVSSSISSMWTLEKQPKIIFSQKNLFRSFSQNVFANVTLVVFCNQMKKNASKFVSNFPIYKTINKHKNT